MEKRKNNTTKTKKEIKDKKVAKASVKKTTVVAKKTSNKIVATGVRKPAVKATSKVLRKNSSKMKTLGIVSGVLNIVACLAVAVMKKQLWSMKFELWEVLVGVLVFALLIWANMSHIIHAKKEKEEISTFGMNVFGSAKLVTFWSMLSILIIMGLGQVTPFSEFLQLFEIATTALVVFGTVVMTLMHYTMMKDLNMKWDMGFYVWIFIWGLLSGLMYCISSVFKFTEYNFTFEQVFIKETLIQVMLDAFILAVMAGVIGEVYKRIINRKK